MAKTFTGGLKNPIAGFTNITGKTEKLPEAVAVYAPLTQKLGAYSPEELMKALVERGVRGLPLQTKKPTRLVLNFAESDAGIRVNSLLACNYPDRIVMGSFVLMRIYGAAKATYAFPSSYYDEANAVNEKIPDEADFVKIVTVADKYPLCDPLCMMSAAEELEISDGKKITDTTVLHVTPKLCCAVYEALALGYPAGNYYSVGGDSVGFAELVRGTGDETAAELASLAGASGEVFPQIGGVILGKEWDGSGKIPPDTDGILFMKKRPVKKTVFDCIMCGRCDAVCPMRLVPSMLTEKLKLGMKIDGLGAERCIGCGCCSYVCPCGCEPADEIKRYVSQEE